MNKLDQYFKEYNNIDENEDYDSFYMKAKELINPRRIDIIAKYYYIKARETGENLDFAKELYEKHIEAFSDGTFEEEGDGYKTSLDRYFEIFDNLIDDFKENGFDEEKSVIPVGKHNEILDGSHRVACALYFEEDVKVMKFEDISVDYGFEFFKKRLLDEKYLVFISKIYKELCEDYDNVLCEIYVSDGKQRFTKLQPLMRKIRYIYRTIINKIKIIIGKPV